MFSVSWVEIRDLFAERLTEWLDFLKHLDLISELRELAQVVSATEAGANLLAAVGLYVLPLLWLMRRWRRGGFLAVVTDIRMCFLAVMLMFAVVALLGRLEERTYRW